MHGLIDMERSVKPDEMMAGIAMSPNKYPYGLQISLTEEELQKLDVDHSEWRVGETFHLHAFAKVTSISENEREGGEKTCCIGLQITHLQGESEDAEDEEVDEKQEPLAKHGYYKNG
jgi:hypothetical protein